MSFLSPISTLLILLHLVSTGPISQKLSQFPSEFNADNIHLLNDEQIRALIELSGQPEYHASRIDPEAYMTMEQIIRYHGYPVEIYTVQTADGYILTMQRIPYGKTGSGSSPRKPVLVQHGLLCSAASWVTNIPEKNLPYILADAGYDVWLGNIRGTLFGRNHTTYNPNNDDRFWKYSFDQMAQYDVPAMIDFMLLKTGFKQIYYIGHSMGTAMMFALLSSEPKYNDIVHTFFALAPVARLKDVRTPLRMIAPFSSQANFILSMLGTGEFFTNSNLLKFLASSVCTSSLKFLCENILFVICGYNQGQLNSTRMPVHLHHTPAATSVQNLVHFGQLVNKGKFQKFDYGEKKNMQVHGLLKPPEYTLNKITSQVALFWSDNDLLASPTDVSWLKPKLENLVLTYRVKDENFSHLDFLWAIDIKPLVYDKLLSTMKKLWK